VPEPRDRGALSLTGILGRHHTVPVHGAAPPDTNAGPRRATGCAAPQAQRMPLGLRRPEVAGRYRELRAHLRSPLYRNAYALMVNTGVTGLLGVAYWLLAARHYTAVEVGRASAIYAAMSLLSGLTAFSLLGAVTRFVPESGRRTGFFVRRAYLFSSLASVLVTVPFLLTVRHWGASYAQLTGLIPGLVFIACVIAWGIFTLQDGVLTGLRSAPWVPLENGTFGVVKIVLLLALAAAVPALGIDISWMLPVIVSLPLINLLIFGKLLPRHQLVTSARRPPAARQIGRFLAGDYTGALCMLAVANLLPIAVAVRSGPGMTAYFYMAWTVGGVLDLLAVNMATSLTVEGAFDSQTLAANCRSALRRTLFILVPTAALVALIARPALSLYGPSYAAYGAPILELLALATLPRTLTELYLGALRAQSRTRLVAVIQVTRCVLILGLALGLTTVMGITGAGIAALASQLIIALAILPGLRRVLAADRPRPAAAHHRATRWSRTPPAAARIGPAPAPDRAATEDRATTGWVQLPGTAAGPVELAPSEVELPRDAAVPFRNAKPPWEAAPHRAGAAPGASRWDRHAGRAGGAGS